jgi:outer membrane protein/adhesin transport system outer membrane protein
MRPTTSPSPLRTFATAILASAAIACALPGAAAAQSINDAFVATYQTNPTLAAEREVLRATNEQVAQALSGYRPFVQATGDAGLRYTDDEQLGDETLTPASVGIDITQPLYRGGRTQADVERAEAVVQAERANYVSIEQQVLLDAATAYLNVVREQAVLDLAINNEQVLRRQLQAARDRFQVGEITRTDVSQAESRLAGATADRIDAEGLLRAARAAYERVIGSPPGTLRQPGPVAKLPVSLDESVALAETTNPFVIGSQFLERAAAAGVDIAFGQLLPEVNLSGLLRHSYETRADDNSETSAAVVAQVTVPLYQAGAAESQVREARYNQNQRRIEVEEARRASVENAIRAWEALQTSRASIDSLRSQVRAAEIALDGVQQEAQVGSRTVLDVLDAEQELLDARVSLVRAQRDEVVAAYSLLATVGRLTARSLELPVAYYDFDPDYDATRNKWWGTSIEGN